jgi:hypothetical protein
MHFNKHLTTYLTVRVGISSVFTAVSKPKSKCCIKSFTLKRAALSKKGLFRNVREREKKKRKRERERRKRERERERAL